MSLEDEKVISLTSRRPWQQEQAEQQEAARIEMEEKEAKAEAAASEYESRLQNLAEEIVDLVANKKIDGLVVIGQNSKSGHFYSNLLLPNKRLSDSCAFAYVGAMETLALELKEVAAAAPCIMGDGKLLDPNELPDVELADEDDYE